MPVFKDVDKLYQARWRRGRKAEGVVCLSQSPSWSSLPLLWAFSIYWDLRPGRHFIYQNGYYRRRDVRAIFSIIELESAVQRLDAHRKRLWPLTCS